MSSKGKRPTVRVVRSDRPDVASRIAWTYLACLLSLVVGGLVLGIVHAFVSSYGCQLSDPDAASSCQLAWVIVSFGVGSLAGFGIFMKVFKLDVWVWCALAALGLGMLVVGQVWDWWWWVILLLVPAAAAVSSASWAKAPHARRVHHVVLVAVVALAAIGAGVWFATG